MYRSSRCLRSTPKRCYSIRLQLCFLLHSKFVEFFAQSRRREPLLSGRIEHDFRGEDSNGNPFAFPTEPLKIGFLGRSHVHVNGVNNA